MFDEYIDAVKSRISWKRARNIATLELKDHMNDKMEELLSSGTDEKMAAVKVIECMGDPYKIGEELDRVYRPKINVMLLELTSSLIIIGIIINYLTDNLLRPDSFAAVVIGLTAASVLYFFDYTVLFRHPIKVYSIHLMITLLFLLYDARNGLGMILYSYTFYPLFLFPVSLCITAFYIGSTKRKNGAYIFTLFAAVPASIAVIISSIPAFMIIVMAYVMIILYGVRKKWFRISFKWVAFNLCLILSGITASFSLSRVYGMRMFTTDTESSFVRQLISDSLHSAELYYGSNNSVDTAKQKILRESFPFVMIAKKYGYIITVIMVLLFIALLCIMLYTAFRQKTEAGRITAFISFFVLAFQFICSVISNIPFFVFLSLNIPFILNGGIFTVMDFILIGIILSVSRHETIAKELFLSKKA